MVSIRRLRRLLDPRVTSGRVGQAAAREHVPERVARRLDEETAGAWRQRLG